MRGQKNLRKSDQNFGSNNMIQGGLQNKFDNDFVVIIINKVKLDPMQVVNNTKFEIRS